LPGINVPITGVTLLKRNVMSIYLEFPAIADYPVYTPLNELSTIVPDWLVNAVRSCMPEPSTENTESGDQNDVV
jgi:hypothetical protein